MEFHPLVGYRYTFDSLFIFFNSQKSGELRTELAEKTETLSEGNPTLDRVSRKKRNIVKRQGTSDRVGRKNRNIVRR